MFDPMAEHDRMIAVDWGTTNFRAYLIDEAGKVLDRRQAPHGILNVPDGNFTAAFDEHLGEWLSLQPGTTVLMSGMIGSRQGWLETAYAECPASINDLAGQMTALPDRKNTFIVPGIAWHGPNAGHDVMRGEEVQVFGALTDAGGQERVLCLPGTHSKWVTMKNGHLQRFATCMTGEMFSVLKEHSILGRLMQNQAHDDDAFDEGLTRSGDAGGLLHHLFGVRTEGLFDEIAADKLAAYLSGILIGHEVDGMLEQFATSESVLLIGDSKISALYARALDHAGAASEFIDSEQATVRGLALLARQLKTESP